VVAIRQNDRELEMWDEIPPPREESGACSLLKPNHHSTPMRPSIWLGAAEVKKVY